MQRNYKILIVVLLALISITIIFTINYNSDETIENSENFIIEREEIVFEEGTYFAVENLGYNLDIDLEDILFIELSGDEYYYVVPRYDTMSVKIYETNFDNDYILMYESKNAKEFVIKGNESDIFPNIVIEFTTSNGEEITFSPFISLKDGSLDIGQYGVEVINIF